MNTAIVAAGAVGRPLLDGVSRPDSGAVLFSRPEDHRVVAVHVAVHRPARRDLWRQDLLPRHRRPTSGSMAAPTGTAYDNCGVEVRLPYLDGKKPGHKKMFQAIDATVSGTWRIAVSYDFNNPDAEETVGTIGSRPGTSERTRCRAMTATSRCASTTPTRCRRRSPTRRPL